jgi:hypothetical protein
MTDPLTAAIQSFEPAFLGCVAARIQGEVEGIDA